MAEPEKLPLTTLDIPQTQTDKLKELFPEVFTEGDKLDFDRLRATLGDAVDNGPERFGLTWPGKRDCFRLIQEPSTGTLLPVEEESVKWDTTQNLFIEADNLETLKLLQKSYYGKVKMIYTDPPYNTGKDFIYPDRYAENLQTYLAYTGQASDEGYRFTTNPDTDGRFHSRWLNMMYPRLFLARNFLRDDGVIFVSINDTEVTNLKLVMDEIFGEENKLAQFVIRTDGNFDNQAKVKICHEYVLAYTKGLEKFPHPPIIDPSVKPNSKLFREEIRNTIVKNGPENPISGIELPIGFPVDFESGEIKKRNDAFPWYSNEVMIMDGKTQNLVTVSSGWSSKELLQEFIDNNFKPIEDSKGQETTFSISNFGAIEIIKKRRENQIHVISVLTGLGSVQSMSEELKKEAIFSVTPNLISF